MNFDSQYKAKLSLLFATIAVSGASIFISYCESPAVIIAFWRIFLVISLLTPLLSSREIRAQFKPVLNKNYMKFFLLSGFFLSLHFFSWIQSLKYTSVAASVIVVNSSPLWVILFSFVFFRESINPYQIIGLIMCILGVIIIALADSAIIYSDTHQEGVILALFGAFMVAFYFIIGRRMRSHYNVGNIPYTYFVNAFCTVFLLGYSILLTESIIVFPITDLIWFFALAIGPSLFGHALYSYAMKKLSAQVVSLSVLGEAIGASVLGFMFLSQSLTETTLIGGVLIGVGIILAVIKEEISD